MSRSVLLPVWVVASLELACSLVICVCILLVYCFMTNSWSVLVPQPKHAPLIEYCNASGTFGNTCWE